MLAVKKDDKFVVGGLDPKISDERFVFNVADDFYNEYEFVSSIHYPVLKIDNSECMVYYGRLIPLSIYTKDNYICYYEDIYSYKFEVYKGYLIISKRLRKAVMSGMVYYLFYPIDISYIREAIDDNSIGFLYELCKLYRDKYVYSDKLKSFARGEVRYSLKQIYDEIKKDDIMSAIVSGTTLAVTRFKMALAEMANVKPIRADFKNFIIRYTDNDIMLWYKDDKESYPCGSLISYNTYQSYIVDKGIRARVRGIMNFAYTNYLMYNWTDEMKMKWARFLKAFPVIEEVR